MSLDPHLRWKGEEEGNPGLVARNTEWFFSSRGVRASAGVEVTIIDSQPMEITMARRTSNPEPAMLSLYINAGSSTGIQTDYVDLSQIASIVNRRFYRQGLNWAVAGIKVMTGPEYSGNVTLSKLPNTWTMSNSWKKSMETWQRMNREALSESESVRPKFLDFKVYADADHHQVGFGNNLIPQARGLTLGGVTGTYDEGEWESSKIVIPLTDGSDNAFSREFVAVGGNYPGNGASGLNAVSLIEGYAASRGLPNVLDPNAPDDAADVNGSVPQNWMAATFNEGTDQDELVLDDMITENNVAPYPFENGPIVGGGTYGDTQYPGGANQGTGLEIHDFALVTGTTIGGMTRLKGGNFPCGLMRLDWSTSGPASSRFIIIDLIPGNHRGYLAEPMQEM